MEKSKYTTKQEVQRLTTAAVLSALSIVIMGVLHFPIFPSAPFYEMDFADVPVLICTSLLGPLYGLLSLVTVCIVQAVTVSSVSGLIGFYMHFLSSGLMIIVVDYIRKHNEGVKGVITSVICGIFVKTLVMIPLNIWQASMFMGISMEQFINTILNICIAFNVIKAATNIIIYSLIASVIEKEWHKLFKKNRKKQPENEVKEPVDVKEAE